MRRLRGLEKVCKLYGRMYCGDVLWVWNYRLNRAVPDYQMPVGSKEWKESEKAKWYEDMKNINQKGKIVIKKTKSGNQRGAWRYWVIAANGETLIPNEGYTTKAGAERGFLALAAVMLDYTVERLRAVCKT